MSHLDQDSVGNRLSGQAGACGAKRQRKEVFVAESKEGLDFLDRPGQHDRAGDHAIEACVRRKGDPVDRASEDALGVDYSRERLLQSFGSERCIRRRLRDLSITFLS